MLTIGLIGCTNAGKSSLFNKLIGTHRAIVTDIHGTTRDILSDIARVDGIGECTILDCPGLDDEGMERELIKKIIIQSDMLYFLVDHRTGLSARDQDLSDMITQMGMRSKTVFTLTKVDTDLNSTKRQLVLADYYHLGYEHVACISTQHNRRDELKRASYIIAETMQVIADVAKEELEGLEQIGARPEINGLPIAIIGRPNVGKSTLMNQIAGKEIAKVSDIPGTTLDYTMIETVKLRTNFTIYDTAGIRRKSKTVGLEKIALEKTRSMLRYINPIIMFLIDGESGITKTDMSLMQHVHEINLPTIVVINKIDTLDTKQKKRILEDVGAYFGHHDRFTTLGISAKTGVGIDEVFKLAKKLRKAAHQEISTHNLNTAIKQAFITTPPTFPATKVVKVYYATQTKVYPPQFMLFINKKTNVTTAFENWLHNQLRAVYGYSGIPMKFLYRDKQMDEEGYEEHLQKRMKSIRKRQRTKNGLGVKTKEPKAEKKMTRKK